MKKKEIKKRSLAAFAEYNQNRLKDELPAYFKFWAVMEPLQEECGKSKHDWRFWPLGQRPFGTKKESHICQHCLKDKEDLGV